MKRRIVVATLILLLPTTTSLAQMGPKSMQDLLYNPELNQGAAGITPAERDVSLSGIGGIVWGTDIRYLQNMKYVGESRILGGMKHYQSTRPLKAIEGVRIDAITFGFWNGMLCHATIDIGDTKRYVGLKQKFTSAFGPPSAFIQNNVEKISWRPKLAIVLMRYENGKARVTIWSEELYAKMAAMYQKQASY